MNRPLVLFSFILCISIYARNSSIQILFIDSPKNLKEFKAFKILEGKLIRWFQNFSLVSANRDSGVITKEFLNFEKDCLTIKKIALESTCNKLKSIHDIEIVEKKINEFKYPETLGPSIKQIFLWLSLIKWKMKNIEEAKKLLLKASNIDPSYDNNFKICESDKYMREFLNSDFFKNTITSNSKISLWIDIPRKQKIRINNFVIGNKEKVKLSTDRPYLVEFFNGEIKKYKWISYNNNKKFILSEADHDVLFLKTREKIKENLFLIIELVNNEFKLYLYTKDFAIDEITFNKPILITSLLTDSLTEQRVLFSEKAIQLIRKHLDYNERQKTFSIDDYQLSLPTGLKKTTPSFSVLSLLGLMISVIHLINK